MLGGVVHFGLVTILAIDSGFSFLVHMLSSFQKFITIRLFCPSYTSKTIIVDLLTFEQKRSYCKYPSILLINAALLVNTIRENLLEREKVSINSYFFLFGGKIWQKLGRMIKFL